MTILPPVPSPNASLFGNGPGTDHSSSLYRPSGDRDFPTDDADMPPCQPNPSASSVSPPQGRAKPDFSTEEAFWEVAHLDQPYAGEDDYERYEAAYRIGYEGFARLSPDYSFDDVEEELQEEFEEEGTSLPWSRAREATRAAWDRMETRRQDAGMGAGVPVR